MFDNMNKVVKCKRSQCGLYFGYAEKNTKCPFCKTEYGEVIEKETKDLSAQAGKKGTTKTQKSPFKIWKGN